MVGGEVGITFSAEKADFPKNLGLVTLLAEGAIGVLDITGRKDGAIGNLEEVAVIAAVGANNTDIALLAQLLMYFG